MVVGVTCDKHDELDKDGTILPRNCCLCYQPDLLSLKKPDNNSVMI